MTVRLKLVTFLIVGAIFADVATLGLVIIGSARAAQISRLRIRQLEELLTIDRRSIQDLEAATFRMTESYMQAIAKARSSRCEGGTI